MSADFIVKSKTLLILSVSLSIIHLVGLEITEINLLGNKAAIQNPEIALVTIWLFWTYFLWRHWQMHISSITRLKPGYKNHFEVALRRYAFASIDDATKEHWKTEQRGPLNLTDSDLTTGYFSARCAFYSPRGISPTHEPLTDLLADQRIGFVPVSIKRLESLFYLLVKDQNYTDIWFPYLVALAPVVIAIAKNAGAFD